MREYVDTCLLISNPQIICEISAPLITTIVQMKNKMIVKTRSNSPMIRIKKVCKIVFSELVCMLKKLIFLFATK